VSTAAAAPSTVDSPEVAVSAPTLEAAAPTDGNALCSPARQVCAFILISLLILLYFRAGRLYAVNDAIHSTQTEPLIVDYLLLSMETTVATPSIESSVQKRQQAVAEMSLILR